MRERLKRGHGGITIIAKERKDKRVEREKVKRGCDAIVAGARDEREKKEDRV